MAKLDITDTVSIELPEGIDAQQRPVGTRRTRGGGMEALDLALLDAEYEIEAEIELKPLPQTGARRTPGGREAITEPTLRVDVAPDEGAVVLLESGGGVFSWLLPEPEPGASRRRRDGDSQTLVFSLATPARRETGAAAGRRGRRGVLSWIGNRLLEPVRVRVLRFAAGVAIDAVLEKVEGEHRQFGLVDMSGASGSWRPGHVLAPFDDGPAEVLLMVHGTFSSTIGSFAGLELTGAGKTFLESARARYDRVLGFDHRTLGHDPEQNARDILQVLQALPKNSSIDAVAYSRGGLVLRSLEKVAAQERSDLQFRRAIFVACTNGGTHLAEAENWHDLVDLYTNVVVAGARAVSLISGGVAGGLIASGVSAIGRFVKFLPQLAIEEKKVPGLAAMEPDGEFVRSLNGEFSASDGTAYFVVASDFEPRIEPSKGITGELAEYLIDRVVDRLFKGIENDLVVDTASMWDFGTSGDRLRPDCRFVIPTEDAIYHTIYFATETLGLLLGRWLAPETAAVAPDAPPPEDLRETLPASLPTPEFRSAKRSGHPSIGGSAIEWSHTGFDRSLGAGVHPGPDDAGGGGGGGGEDWASMLDGEPDESGVPFDLDDDMFDPAPVVEPGEAAPAGGRRPRRRGGSRDPAEPEVAAPRDVPDGAEANDVRCHFAAEMQPTPVLGVPVPLFVTVSPQRINVAPSPSAAATESPVSVDQKQQIQIQIIPGRNCRVFGMPDVAPPISEALTESPALQVIDVPSKRSASLRFEIEGIAPGEAEVFIEARQGPRLLASFLLKPVFVVQSDARITASQVARPMYSLDDEPAVLRIYEMHLAHGALRLRFELSSEKPNIFIQQDVDLRPNFKLEAFVADYLRALEDAYKVRRYDLILQKITDFSIVQTRSLIPDRVRQKLWDHRDKIKAVQVISEEPLIPWELLYIDDPSGRNHERNGFLAEWGLVRWMYNAPWPTRELPLRQDRIFYVIPDYLEPRDKLSGAAQESDMLKERFPGAQPVEPTSPGVRKFLRDRGGDCDLLHFACHGLAEQKAVLSSDLLMQGFEDGGAIVEDVLPQESVKVDASFGEHAPSGLVFINACQTGRVGEGIAGVMGFADSFIRPNVQQGANAFVGALWSVDDKLALTFADTFYERMLAGDTLVVAARAAREACKQNEDFTWLAYSLYGHPFAKVSQDG